MTTTLVAIGDLHGHAPALEALLEALRDRGGVFASPGRLARSVKLVLMGDYIDRGTQGLAIIDRLRDLQRRNPGRVVTLLGNHELLALQCLDEARALVHLRQAKAFEAYRETEHGANGGCDFVLEFGPSGGRQAFARYVARMDRDGDVGAWIRRLVPFHRDEVAGRRFLFSHGDVPESLLGEGALERYGQRVALRMRRGATGPGGTRRWFGDDVFTSERESLFWCRDFAGLARVLPMAIDRVCEKLGVDHVVTGHNMHRGRIVTYGGRIFDIDVGMTPDAGENEPQALVVTREGIAALTAGGVERVLAP